MELNLTNKIAVVTGAGRGIGLAITRVLIAEGARVVAAARSITPELHATGARAVSADLSTPEGVTALIEAALTEHGRIDLLVNNVGGGSATYGFLGSNDTEWEGVLALNLLGAVRASRAALPSILENRGAIVNISSTLARLPGYAPASYAAAKAALTAFSKSLSEEFGPQGVRVNTVSPGLVRTPVYQEAAAASGVTVDELAQQLISGQNITTGRMSEPEEIAALVAFLLSDLAANITGADYVIDGGGIKTV